MYISLYLYLYIKLYIFMYFIELRVVKADGEKVYESGNDVTYR